MIFIGRLAAHRLVLVVQKVVAQRPVGQPGAVRPRLVELGERAAQLAVRERLERQPLGVAEARHCASRSKSKPKLMSNTHTP